MLFQNSAAVQVPAGRGVELIWRTPFRAGIQACYDAGTVPAENVIRRAKEDTGMGQLEFWSESVIGSASDSDRNGARDRSIPGTAHEMAARDGLARMAVISFDQAARRYVWCKPPRTGGATSLPRSCWCAGHGTLTWRCKSSGGLGDGNS